MDLTIDSEGPSQSDLHGNCSGVIVDLPQAAETAAATLGKLHNQKEQGNCFIFSCFGDGNK